MPIIKPVSDLRNYTEVVRESFRLLSELVKGRKSGEQQGWLSIEDVEAALCQNTVPRIVTG